MLRSLNYEGCLVKKTDSLAHWPLLNQEEIQKYARAIFKLLWQSKITLSKIISKSNLPKKATKKTYENLAVLGGGVGGTGILPFGRQPGLCEGQLSYPLREFEVSDSSFTVHIFLSPGL